MQKNNKTVWEEYVAREQALLLPVLTQLGYTLDENQPHILGERYLTGSGGRKLVLLGKDAHGKKVVIKASSDASGIEEMKRERRSREALERIGFAYQTFLAPQELVWGVYDGLAVLITEFIEQDKPFLERPLKEQFALALKAFKAQESAHATTSSHLRAVRHDFEQVQRYVQDTKLSNRAIQFISDNQETIEQYGGFLTHWDFTPQNFRIRNGEIYLLDHSSIRFGNKYEGWARFINFMELYNPPLAQALVQYVRDNRAPEELLSLRLMRVYRLMELIRYYATWLSKTSGDLHALAEARIAFWSEVMRCVLDEKQVPADVVESYKKTRDSLRSEEEKQRQVGLH